MDNSCYSCVFAVGEDGIYVQQCSILFEHHHQTPFKKRYDLLSQSIENLCGEIENDCPCKYHTTINEVLELRGYTHVRK